MSLCAVNFCNLFHHSSAWITYNAMQNPLLLKNRFVELYIYIASWLYFLHTSNMLFACNKALGDLDSVLELRQEIRTGSGVSILNVANSGDKWCLGASLNWNFRWLITCTSKEWYFMRVLFITEVVQQCPECVLRSASWYIVWLYQLHFTSSASSFALLPLPIVFWH